MSFSSVHREWSFHKGFWYVDCRTALIWYAHMMGLQNIVWLFVNKKVLCMKNAPDFMQFKLLIKCKDIFYISKIVDKNFSEIAILFRWNLFHVSGSNTSNICSHLNTLVTCISHQPFDAEPEMYFSQYISWIEIRINRGKIHRCILLVEYIKYGRFCTSANFIVVKQKYITMEFYSE